MIEDQPPPVAQPGATSVQAMVRADLEEREQVGVERYGTPLQPHNGRDALVDAYQEALDLSCYLRQALAERPGEGTTPPREVGWLHRELAAQLGRPSDTDPAVLLDDVRIPDDAIAEIAAMVGVNAEGGAWPPAVVSAVRSHVAPAAPETRRLHWQLFEENGWGVILSDLTTKEWAHGSADTEAEARRIARCNLDERPSGGKPDPRWTQPDEPMTLPIARRVLSVWASRETGPGADALAVVLAALDQSPPHRAGGES